MNDQLNGRLKVKAVNAHNGLAVDKISLRAEIDENIAHRYGLDKDSDVLDGGETDPLLLHNLNSFLCVGIKN